MNAHGATVIAWIALALSVFSVCFTGFAVWTGVQKLRLDLYNRRFDIYSRTLDFYQMLPAWNPSEQEKRTVSLCDSPAFDAAQKAFIKASRESQFLFKDQKIRELLEQMHKDSMTIIGYKREPIFDKVDLVTRTAEINECWKRILGTIPSLEKGMAKYLNFHRI